MKKFESPELEEIKLDIVDVITTSPDPVGPTEGGNGTPIG